MNISTILIKRGIILIFIINKEKSYYSEKKTSLWEQVILIGYLLFTIAPGFCYPEELHRCLLQLQQYTIR